MGPDRAGRPVEEIGVSDQGGNDVRRLAVAMSAAEREIDQLREERSRKARNIDQLLHSVTHELRTPITIIQGYSKLLLSGQVGALGEEQERFVTEVHRAAQRMDRFVKDLLEATPREGLELAVSVELSSVDELVHDVVSYLGPLVDEGGRGVELRIEAGLPQVPMDAGRIEQVLTNLMTNALRYSKAGGVITIEAARARLDDGAAAVEIAVGDQGRGVPAADRRSIFEPYYRGGAVSLGSEGLGLGLAICKRIVDAHGGTIEVGDSEDGGARFAFRLPIEVRVHTSEGRR